VRTKLPDKVQKGRAQSPTGGEYRRFHWGSRRVNDGRGPVVGCARGNQKTEEEGRLTKQDLVPSSTAVAIKEAEGI